MDHLFLDANILLDFYRFGEDDIDEVYKLAYLVRDKDVKLYVSSHLRDEVERNREKVILESLKSIEGTKYSVRAPNFCLKMVELKSLQSKLREANVAHLELVTKVKSQVATKLLAADRLIDFLFRQAENIELTDDLLQKAQRRHLVGNPPGKRDSVGDSIHWETLLSASGPWWLDLVSRDGDFASELDPSSLKPFLLTEWKKKRGPSGRVILFRSLADYFKSKFPRIKISDESEKNSLIAQIATSDREVDVRSVIAKLARFPYFTRLQINKLFSALTANPVLQQIAMEDDIRNLSMRFQDRAYLVDDNLHTKAAEYLGVEEEVFFSPF